MVDAYFSATKVKWLLDHVEGAREKARRGELAFGTIDAWLIWNLTGGRVHATDVTNAARTMLFDIHRRAWDERLLEALDIPPSLLPEVKPSSAVLAHTIPTCSVSPFPLPAWPATSKPPSLARPALRRGWPRTPTARAASCS